MLKKSFVLFVFLFILTSCVQPVSYRLIEVYDYKFEVRDNGFNNEKWRDIELYFDTLVDFYDHDSFEFKWSVARNHPTMHVVQLVDSELEFMYQSLNGKYEYHELANFLNVKIVKNNERSSFVGVSKIMDSNMTTETIKESTLFPFSMTNELVTYADMKATRYTLWWVDHCDRFAREIKGYKTFYYPTDCKNMDITLELPTNEVELVINDLSSTLGKSVWCLIKKSSDGKVDPIIRTFLPAKQDGTSFKLKMYDYQPGNYKVVYFIESGQNNELNEYGVETKLGLKVLMVKDFSIGADEFQKIIF